MDRVYSLPYAGFWMFPNSEDDEGGVFYSFQGLMANRIPVSAKCLRHRKSGVTDILGSEVGLEEERNTNRKNNTKEKSHLQISYEIYNRRREIFHNDT